MRCRVSDADAGEAPLAGRGVVAGREVHQLVLAGAAADDRRVLLARALDKHLLGAADPCTVAGEGGALDHDGQTLEPLCRHFGSHEAVVAARGLGAGARREEEGVRAVVAGFGHHLERALEVVFGLSRETDDEVGGHSEVVDLGARRGQLLEVALGRVAAVHRRQRAVAPGLEREVEVLAHRRRLSHCRDRLGPQVLGVRTGEAHPADAVGRAQRAQEVGEERPPPGQVATVRVDVLPEQRDLDGAGGGERRGFLDDLRERTADLAPAHRRHDAEGTAVVTADLNGQPRRERQVAPRGQRARKGL